LSIEPASVKASEGKNMEKIWKNVAKPFNDQGLIEFVSWIIYSCLQLIKSKIQSKSINS